MRRAALIHLLVAMSFSFMSANSVIAKTTTHSIKVDDKKRRYKVHVPKNCKDEVMLPVVIVLHGAGSSPSSIRLVTGMSKMARKLKFIAVYPEGTGNKLGLLKTWNAGIKCGPAYKKSVDDVAYIEEIIDEVNQNYNTDYSRVFVAGMSNGGMMAYRLASELGDKIAAIGIVESSMFCEKPERGSAVNVVAFHSKRDRVIPLDGGTGIWYGYRFRSPSVRESLRYWVDRNECDKSVCTTKANGYTKYRYSGGKNSTEVVFYLIEDGGHSWPGAIGIPPLYSPSKKLSATEKMCEFFMSRK